ncbi:MAG: MgtC/SapB family protein, partial [Rhodobacterales bacterium]|nr:MgtC/SapB family protein [Rhodobacterales bacterium]MDX5413115.1 MgtC/SapB family protein [Rhodobacterales bacterium]
MDQILNQFSTQTYLGWDTIIVRLLAAVLFSGLIGFERESRNRPAGLRTHMLVGLASAAYCLIMLEILASSKGVSDDLAMDPLRLLE